MMTFILILPPLKVENLNYEPSKANAALREARSVKRAQVAIFGAPTVKLCECASIPGR